MHDGGASFAAVPVVDHIAQFGKYSQEKSPLTYSIGRNKRVCRGKIKNRRLIHPERGEGYERKIIRQSSAKDPSETRSARGCPVNRKVLCEDYRCKSDGSQNSHRRAAAQRENPHVDRFHR